jgi:hypothetical protein
MKYLMLVLPVLYFLSIQCSSVPKVENDYISVDTSKIVEEITIFRDIIEKRSGEYKRVIRDLKSPADTGKLIALFTESEEIKKIIVNFYEDQGKRNIEFFFRDNDYLLYVRDMLFTLTDSLTNQQKTMVVNSINEFYFNENNLFLWKLKDQKMNPAFYHEKSKEIFSHLEQILIGIKN